MTNRFTDFINRNTVASSTDLVGGRGGADEDAGLSLAAELVAKALNGP